jgi:hypothetical protein
MLFGPQVDGPVSDKALEFACTMGKEKFDKLIDSQCQNYNS